VVYNFGVGARLRLLPAIFLGYTALGLFLAAANSLTYVSTGGAPNWEASIKRSLAEWYAWAALTPLILYLADRFPLTRRTLIRNGALHLAAMLVVGILKLIVDQQIRLWLFGRAPYLLLSSLAFNVLVYWAIVAAAHGASYHRTSRARELQASQLETRLADTRLQLLSMQLQPHFLFNTLNAIAELLHEEPETADRMIAGLSVLLRETLDAGVGREIDLRRELALLECYIDIQRTRFGPRLQASIDADPAALDAAVPALLLQPFVENSIKHGLSARAAAGRIEVTARREAGRIALAVRDDGAGLNGGNGRREGIGLANTRARLEAMFAQDFALDVSTAPSGGVIVQLSIPYRPVPARGAGA
jgi:two-component system, LytTR family, sensor kinase